MGEFSTLLQQGNGWFFIPSAILLGILHGLEPGHSKTMMAAFIIAIKGTVKQAVMLGLAATLSHTAIVWLIALGGMYLSRAFTAQSVEPWLQLISAIIILSTACWMFWRTWRGEQQWLAGNHHPWPGINAGDGRRGRGDKRSTGSKALEWFFDACPAGALFFEHSDWSGRRVYGNSWLYRDHAVNM